MLWKMRNIHTFCSPLTILNIYAQSDKNTDFTARDISFKISLCTSSKDGFKLVGKD
jgi:hypothetical protein